MGGVAKFETDSTPQKGVEILEHLLLSSRLSYRRRCFERCPPHPHVCVVVVVDADATVNKMEVGLHGGATLLHSPAAQCADDPEVPLGTAACACEEILRIGTMHGICVTQETLQVKSVRLPGLQVVHLLLTERIGNSMQQGLHSYIAP